MLNSCNICAFAVVAVSISALQFGNMKADISDELSVENPIKLWKRMKTDGKRTRIKVTRGSCCDLGGKMAKHGYKECDWSRDLAFNLRLIDRQWKQKSPVTGASPAGQIISVRLLRKCKRFKSFFNKCCLTEKIANEIFIEKLLARLGDIATTLQRHKEFDMSRAKRSGGEDIDVTNDDDIDDDSEE